jgi:hypothetical protein
VSYYAYRIVKTSSPDVEQFKSHAALMKPRPPNLLPAHPDPWDGCSVLMTFGDAVARARRTPRLGGFIAELFVPDGAPVTRDSADASGHFNIWGDPTVLFGYLSAVLPVP